MRLSSLTISTAIALTVLAGCTNNGLAPAIPATSATGQSSISPVGSRTVHAASESPAIITIANDISDMVTTIQSAQGCTGAPLSPFVLNIQPGTSGTMTGYFQPCFTTADNVKLEVVDARYSSSTAYQCLFSISYRRGQFVTKLIDQGGMVICPMAASANETSISYELAH